MTWLFSIYWIGALAVAGPVLFHMWRRTPRGKRAFSTLMFLAPSPPRVTSRSRIEHWVLLLLRAAALALLAFAFTRPLWRSQITEPVAPPNEKLLAIVVDTSASMRREGLFENLVRQLDERLSTLPPETFAALYRFDGQFEPIAGFNELNSLEPSTRLQLLRGRLAELTPTWRETRLGEALVRAAGVLQDIRTERPKAADQRIWLAGDLQSGSEVLALQGYEWPSDLPVELIAARPKIPGNAGLQLVDRNLESADNIVRVRVTNSADSLKEQFHLKWDGGGSSEIAVYVPPGQSRIVTPPVLPPGVTSSSLVLTGDDHDFDNRVYIAESPGETRRVVYCGTESTDEAEGARFYLERVFSASQRFVVELKTPSDLTAAPDDLKPSLVVLVDPEPGNHAFVFEHLANGGTVLIASSTPEATLEAMKFCGREGLEVTEATVPKYAMLGDIDFEHPVFAPFAESQFSDFTGIRFWKHRTIAGFQRGNSPNTSERGQPTASPDRVLARFDDGDPAIIEFASQRGRVIVFAAGWIPTDGQFARSSKFPMLMFRLLEHAAGSSPRAGSQIVGSTIEWPSQAGTETAETGTAILPDGTQLTSQPLDRPFSQTDSPGIYTLSVGGRMERIAVNLAGDESRTTPFTEEQLEGFGLRLKARERPKEREYQRDRQRQLQLSEIERSQKLWRTVLIVVLGVLLVETYLGGVFVSRAET